MARWARVSYQGKNVIGQVEGDSINLYDGDLFAQHQPNGQTVSVAEVEWLSPCEPRQFMGLWNNFHQRRVADDLFLPESPLMFVKLSSCVTGHQATISSPPGYDDSVVFEAELGVVIGRECFQVSTEEVDAYIFGYTCVNDVTAPVTLKEEKGFIQWSRAKSFPGFGPVGPWIETDIEPDGLQVQAILDGELLQDYPVSDMIFRPREIVSALSQEIVLLPGDVIACGTSLGATAMKPGQKIEINIDGVGRLENTFK